MHLKVAICPHDTVKDTVTWIDFISYLSKKTGIKFSLENCLDFSCYYEKLPEVDLTYSSPLDALKVSEELGFIPVAGNDNYDEVVIIANEKEEKSLEAIKGKKVLYVANQFASFLRMHILRKKGINAELENRDSWQKVLGDVKRGVAPYGFLYKDFWNDLTRISKEGVVPIYESNERIASHVIMLSPKYENQRDNILEALWEMTTDKKGRKILERLNINHWFPLDSLEHLQKFVEEVRSYGYKGC